jgi:aryl-alcohol dehydrogenase-like predicted oxidoreductase
MESVDIVKRALEAGVNIIDTAAAYETEEIVGKAIKGRDRNSVIISTKMRVWAEMTAKDLRLALEKSLRKLDTEYIDIFHFHGLTLQHYDYVATEMVPEMYRLRDEGKIRAVGVTEMFERDPRHSMLARTVDDDLFDVIMVGFNLLNHTARHIVLHKAIEKNIGIAELVADGKIDPSEVDVNNPFDFMVHHGGAVNVPDAAYRFCRYEPGVHVVLSGTGNAEHLAMNVQSLDRPPLPTEDVEKANRLFERVDNVTGG